jgi:hypothetical protein
MMLTITIRVAIAFLARTGHSALLVSATVVLARLANTCSKLATKRTSAEIACRDEKPKKKVPKNARNVPSESIKRKKANLIVCRAFLEHLKMTRVQKLVKFVAKDNIKINPVMKPVWIAKWVGT